MGGVRSTGATSAMGVAEYVLELLKQNLNQEPSEEPRPVNQFCFSWQKTAKDCMTANGVEYRVTHPITKFGLWSESKPPSAKL